MKKIAYYLTLICLYLFLSSLMLNAQYNKGYKDSLAQAEDSLIGYATTDFYMQVPEGNLGNLVADAVKSETSRVLDSIVDICAINAKSINGKISKGEIYQSTIQKLFRHNDTIIYVLLSKNQLINLINKIAQNGGMPISGFSFKILNMRAKNIVLKRVYSNRRLNYFRMATTAYTLKQLGIEDVTALNATKITLSSAAIAYISQLTRSGNAIYGFKERRISYDN